MISFVSSLSQLSPPPPTAPTSTTTTPTCSVISHLQTLTDDVDSPPPSTSNKPSRKTAQLHNASMPFKMLGLEHPMSPCKFGEALRESRPLAADTKVKESVHKMRNFLESDAIRRIEPSQVQDDSRPSEACPIKDRAGPPSDIDDFSALLHDNSECSSEAEADKVPPLGSGGFCTADDTFSRPPLTRCDSATGELDQDQDQDQDRGQACSLSAPAPPSLFPPWDNPPSTQSPMTRRRFSVGDSGIADSPFLGSPESLFEADWPGVRRVDSGRIDAFTGSRACLFHLVSRALPLRN